MKKIILSMATVIAIAACNQKPEKYTINGNFTGNLENGTQIFLKKIGENNKPVDVDTTTVENGKFVFEGVADIPELHYIFLDKQNAYKAIILENGEIEFNANKDSLGFAEFSGTLQNDIFSDYIEKSQVLSKRAISIQKDMQSATDEATKTSMNDEMIELQDEFKNFELEFIKSNPNSLISVILIDKAIAASKTVDLANIQEMYDALTSEMKETTVAKNILPKLEKAKEREEKLKNTAVGAKAPDFSAPGPDGKEIALNDVMGKVTLVDFWAAWCKPCRAENPNVVAVYKKYHDKGLNILGVSLDRKAENWKQAIETDGLTWNHVSHVQYFGPIAKLYNVSAIPAAFLLDENGVIVAKNLRGDNLEKKVAELLN